MSDHFPDVLSRSTDLRAAIDGDPSAFPYRVELSLEPLIRFWEDSSDECGPAKEAVAAIIRQRLAEMPELRGTIDDVEVMKRHVELLDVLMAAVFPPAFWEQEFGAALVPFQLTAFYATPAFERVLMTEDGKLAGRVNLDAAGVRRLRLLFAHALILHRVYGIDLDADYSLIFTTADRETGLDRHFKMHFDERFVDVDVIGEVPPLADNVRRRLAEQLIDPELLGAVLPVGRFVLRGLTVFNAIEVTDQEVLSSLKRDLIEKESIVSPARFQSLQANLRTLLRRPELRLGVAAIEGERVLVLNSGAPLEKQCIFADSRHLTLNDFLGSIYQRAGLEGRPLLFHDLAALPERTRIEDELIRNGARSFVVAPLHYQDRIIGTLTVSSPKPGDIKPTHLPKLGEVLPLFAMAVKRSLDDFHGRVQAFIKEKCTAIHPVVEWRFRKAVLETLDRRASEPDTAAELEPIVFEKVQPLYALSDIRGSSTQRALAIQADLLAQLRLARAVVDTAYESRPLPALDELRYRIDKHVAQIERVLKSGDEVGVVVFLRNDVESLFGYLEDFGHTTRASISAYRDALDPRVGTVYADRRRFEESVTRLTEAISTYLELEEQTAQSMVPHYFEKQKTDGVDHQIYAGGSLLEDGRFDPFCMKSLRLWQLMVTCGIALRSEQLRPRLPVPLETTHLVLVQHAPLSIRFRFDEKRFDVDGAYDIRYEIVKKRIDKALIKGTTERATQPGQIVIVYTQPAEAVEYRAYIEYLQHLGYLTDAVEEFELEDVQGVRGLRALRLTVDLTSPRADRSISIADLQAAG